MLQAVENTSLPDLLFAQLLGEIVSGRYAVGAQLPPERSLAGVFGVNRHVVREALKRLEQLGLVKTIHGGGTRVLDFRRTAGLDVLAIFAEHAESMEGALPLLQAGIEMRAGIGVDVARLCALRAGPATGEVLIEAAERLAAVGTGREILPLDQAFWQHILDGAANLAYQLAFNSLIRAVNAMPDFSLQWLEHELGESDYRRPIAAAIAAGDAEAAAVATREALTLPKPFSALGAPVAVEGGRR